MNQAIKIGLLLFALAILQWHCVQSYVSPYVSPKTGYLVVEGYISGNGPSSYRLSRTISLAGDSAIPAVTGANLQIEGTDNSTYPLTELGNGYYLLPGAPLNSNTRYRLRISNVGTEQYLSDYVTYKQAPPIDSVNWIQDASGVALFVNTHDPANSTRYYQWKYNETWEYFAFDDSGVIWENDSIVYRPPQQQIYQCYHLDSSSQILINTSEKLARDEIYRQPLVSYAPSTQPLAQVYSILVSQYALTDSAYTYLSEMRTNTEQLGSIFDAQPTNLIGNIHSLSNPAEPVLGYISAGAVTQQRIYITHQQLANWLYEPSCTLKDTSVPNNPAAGALLDFDYIPIDLTMGIISANLTVCVDCRAQGGTTVKPPYMP